MDEERTKCGIEQTGTGEQIKIENRLINTFHERADAIKKQRERSKRTWPEYTKRTTYSWGGWNRQNKHDRLDEMHGADTRHALSAVRRGAC